MGARDVTDRAAVESAISEYDLLGRSSFLDRYGFGQARDYSLIVGGKPYDPKAILGAAHGYQFPGAGPLAAGEFSGGEAETNAILRRLGFTVVRTTADLSAAVDDEREWRLRVWRDLSRHGSAFTAEALRALGIYGGAQGIWVDKTRTQQLAPTGVTVSVLHTGRHYDDDLTDDAVLYHYPRTGRPAGRDQSEVDATKAAAELGIPLFVIAPAPGGRRAIRIGWVQGWDDEARLFLIDLDEQPAPPLPAPHEVEDTPFELLVAKVRRTRSGTTRTGQARFKLAVLQRYGARCALSDIAELELLDAAHLCDDAAGGTNDPRNGLPLSPTIHRALDKHLFAIHPDTLGVVTRPTGPDAAALGIQRPDLRHLPLPPHRDALAWRYQRFLRANRLT